MIFFGSSQINPLPCLKLHYILMPQPSLDISALWHIRQPICKQDNDYYYSILMADFFGAIPLIKNV